jgi:arsenate reductase (thioredoxin)
VFVCEHGSVKSLIAATIFNNAARERRLSFRSISRGIEPDASVPPKIAAALAAEGIDAAGFKPQRLSTSEIGHARRIVSIGVDLSAVAPKNVPVLRWDDVPPASADYAAAHRALTKRVDQLLIELQARP